MQYGGCLSDDRTPLVQEMADKKWDGEIIGMGSQFQALVRPDDGTENSPQVRSKSDIK